MTESIQNVVVTTDFSAESKRALGPAIELARRLGVPLSLLYVVHDPELAPFTYSVAAEMDVAREKLAEIELPNDLEVKLEVTSARDIADGIVAFAAQRQGILVVSSHGHTGLRKFILGSVTENVLQRARTPVVCVPPENA